ncbi:tail fiber assembly protein [Enterobacter roggenkampii]
MRFFSASTTSFYDDTINNNIPDDAIEITDELHTEIFDGQRSGKIITVGNGGLPALAEQLPLTHEELVSQANAKKLSLRTRADSEIAWRQYAVDAGIATTDEVDKLDEWNKYRVLLMRIDTSKAPEIEWPDNIIA